MMMKFSRLPSAVAGLGVAAALTLLPPPAVACGNGDCAACGDPAANAKTPADYGQAMQGIAREAAQLEIALATEQAEPIERATHQLVRDWLDMHAGFFSRPPANVVVDPEQWKQHLTKIHSLMGKAFREARAGQSQAVADRLDALHEQWRRLDARLGLPETYTRIRRLQAAYAAYTEADDTAATVRWQALSPRLEEAESALTGLLENERPALFQNARRPILRHLRAIVEASADERARLIRDAASRLEERLAALQPRLGEADEGEDSLSRAGSE